MQKTLKITIASLFLLLAAAVPFWPFWTEKTSFFTFHALTGLMAIKHQIAQTFLQGEYPLWNPFMLCGVPFHSGIGIADPLLLSYLFRSGVPALLLSAYFALALAGISMFCYLYRGWKLSISASLVGAIFYSLNPFFGAACHEAPFMVPPVYLPLVFLFYEKGLRSGRFSSFLGSGFFLSLVFFSGNLESFFLVTLFFVAAQVIRAFVENRNAPKTMIQEVLLLGVPVVFSLLVAAVDLLPTLDVMRISSRAVNAGPFQYGCFFSILIVGILLVTRVDPRRFRGPVFNFLRWGLGAGVLALFMVQIDWSKGFISPAANLFFPDLSKLMLHGQDAFTLLQTGSGVPAGLLKSFIEPRFIFYVQPPIYVFSLVTFVLFFFVLLRSSGTLIKAWAWLGIMMAIFPFTSMPNVFHYLFRLDLLAYPRLMFGFFFIQSIVIAYGFHHWRSPDSPGLMPKRLLWGISGLALCLAGVAFAWVLKQGHLDPLAFQLSLEDLNVQGGGASEWLRRSWDYLWLTINALRFFLDVAPWLFWFWVAKYAALLFLLGLAFRPGRLWRALFILAFAFEVGAGWNLYVFQKDDVRAVISDFKETRFLRSLSPMERIAIRNDPAVDIMNFYESRRLFDWAGNMPLFWNARTIEGSALNLSPKLFSDFWFIQTENGYTPTVLNVPHSRVYDLMGMNYLFSDQPLSDPAYRLIGRGDRYRYYKNHQALPQFYFSRAVEPHSFDEAREWILGKSWKPLEKTMIEAPPGWRVSSMSSRPHGEGNVELVRERRNSFDLQTRSSREELLSTTSAFNKNWQVRVDGISRDVMRVNLYFLGVFLEPGDHVVSFRYLPQAFRIGSGISLAALFFLALVVVSEKLSRVRKVRS